MTMSNANPNKAPHNQPPMTRAEREARIAEAEARRKREKAEEKAKATAPAPGSKAARVAEATSSGVVKPSKSDRPTKIPSDKNMTRPKDVEDEATAGSDAELDEAVKPKKREKDPNLLSVGDVARELGVDPKRARARLRKLGKSATEGRWARVLKGSKEHDELIAAISDAESKKADAADAT